MPQNKTPVAVTMGEPAGIGPDIALMAWVARKDLGLPPFYMRADPGLLAHRAHRLGLTVPIQLVEPEDAYKTFSKSLPVVSGTAPVEDRPGDEIATTGQDVISSIEGCVRDVHEGRAIAVLTNPINKANLYEAGFSYPGHTEYLGALAEKLWAFDKLLRPVMMIAGPDLMVVPVTIHIALKDVPVQLTRDLIVETGRIVARDLRERFGLAEPRIAVCGLNPHAGENGTMGTEDRDIIAPAVEILQQEGIDVSGPLPADTLFHARARQTYDCALGMYHDQVLVPAKTLAFDDGVNVTLGLPFVRTSPDHGTAYGLAGTGKAKPDSFVAALRMATVLGNPGAL
ncbi:4-hydroxythreonine-4-phosphate dehydrogenase PdxA [Roseibium sp.]|uniref:4-hydroxythreonine-4-phosphate dehydrogenase PdxA n=1 Tax=Roseibium sp. TaxID=1936156 RepID=UPI003A97B834